MVINLFPGPSFGVIPKINTHFFNQKILRFNGNRRCSWSLTYWWRTGSRRIDRCRRQKRTSRSWPATWIYCGWRRRRSRASVTERFYSVWRLSTKSWRARTWSTALWWGNRPRPRIIMPSSAWPNRLSHAAFRGGGGEAFLFSCKSPSILQFCFQTSKRILFSLVLGARNGPCGWTRHSDLRCRVRFPLGLARFDALRSHPINVNILWNPVPLKLILEYTIVVLISVLKKSKTKIQCQSINQSLKHSYTI